MKRFLHSASLSVIFFFALMSISMQKISAQSYSVTATVGPHGAISPSGTITLAQGANQVFTITPDAGYKVSDITLDGLSEGAMQTLSLYSIIANHQINVVFEPLNPVTITSTPGEHGKINPAGTNTYDKDHIPGYSIEPDLGYDLQEIMVDGVSQGTLDPYFFNVASGNHTITATFVQKIFTITCHAGTRGSISTEGTTEVPYGQNFSFEIIPDPGCYVQSLSVDGVEVPPIYGTLGLFAVDANHIINVTFAPNIYTLTTSATGHGSISASPRTSLVGGEDYTITMTPDPGYSVQSILVDGVEKPISGLQYTIPKVDADHTFNVTFGQNIYTITTFPTEHGSFNAAQTTNVLEGQDFTITMTPDPGYSVGGTDVDGVIQYSSAQSYTFSTVTANHKFGVFFTPNIYTLTTSAGPHGSVNPAGTNNVNGGSDVNIIFTPDPGYKVSAIVYDGVSSPLSTQSFLIPTVVANHTLSVTFEPVIYTITASAGAHGSISPNGTMNVNGGSDQAYTITPVAGYKISQVNVDGVSQGSVTQFTFPVIAANHSISASFIPNVFFTIKATAGANGTITPAGSASVGNGNNTTYSITPAAGYHVATLKVDGTSLTPATSYIFTNVAANHTINATFALTSFTITANAGVGGTISPTGTATVSPGGTKTYTIKPSAGYTVLDVTLDGSSIGTVKSYVFTNVSANHLLIATFAPVTYIITSSAGANGSISPSGPTSLAYGGSQTYTFTPSAGYSITKLTVDNKSVTIAPSYTFTNVTAAHTIAVTYSCPKPVAPVLSGPATVTKLQDNLTYTVTNVTGGNSFVWTVPGAASIISGQGTSSITVKWGKTAGSVTCVANSVCSISTKTSYAVALSTATLAMEVPAETQVAEQEINATSLQVNPNPVQDRARVVFTLVEAAKCKISLIDLTGRVLTLTEVAGVKGQNETMVDVSRFANGTYFISLVHGKEMKTVTLIKVH